MTTYRIRPLKWERGEHCDTARIGDGIAYLAYPSGHWEANYFDGERGPYGDEADMDEAKWACENHWNEVLSAALEPVEILPTLQRLREHLVLMMQYGYDDGELAALDGLIALITPTP